MSRQLLEALGKIRAATQQSIQKAKIEAEELKNKFNSAVEANDRLTNGSNSAIKENADLRVNLTSVTLEKETLSGKLNDATEAKNWMEKSFFKTNLEKVVLKANITSVAQENVALKANITSVVEENLSLNSKLQNVTEALEMAKMEHCDTLYYALQVATVIYKDACQEDSACVEQSLKSDDNTKVFEELDCDHIRSSNSTASAFSNYTVDSNNFASALGDNNSSVDEL